MSKNIGFGHVFTDRPSFNKNCGCGLYDSSKVAYVEDSNGKVYVDDVRFGAGYADGTNFIWETVDIVLPVSGNKVSIVVPDENYLDTSKISYSIDGIVIV